MENINLFYGTFKRRYKVLAIEDDPASLRCIERSLPDNCDMIPVDSEHAKICEHGLEGRIISHSENKEVTFKEYFKKLFEENSAELRVIVCDLNLGGKMGGGTEVIKWIRNYGKNEIELPDAYLKYIPIIVYTGATASDNEHRTEALSNGANGYVLKDTSIISDENAKHKPLTRYISQNIDYFQCLYEFLIYRKSFKVALSFTGKNKTIRHREFVEEIAHHLYSCYTKERVFYDVDMLDSGYTVSMTKNEFTKLYNKECEYIVVLVSEDYATKDNPWTQFEWVGINDYYNESSKKIIFVAIEKNINETKFMNDMGIKDVGIWIDASDIREEFYKRMDGKGLAQKAIVNEMSVFDATIKDYTSICYKGYKEICEKIHEKIVRPIVNHICNVDEGKK